LKKAAEIKKAKAVVRASEGAWGPKPITQVLRDQRLVIEAWRADGARWDQIACLLAEAGLRSRSGRTMDPGTLRALFSRAKSGKPVQEDEEAPIAVSKACQPDVGPDRKMSAGKSARADHPNGDQPMDEIALRIRRAAKLRGSTE